MIWSKTTVCCQEVISAGWLPGGNWKHCIILLLSMKISPHASKDLVDIKHIAGYYHRRDLSLLVSNQNYLTKDFSSLPIPSLCCRFILLAVLGLVKKRVKFFVLSCLLNLVFLFDFCFKRQDRGEKTVGCSLGSAHCTWLVIPFRHHNILLLKEKLRCSK